MQAPEYGATCGFFPVDAATIDYPQDLRPQAGARVKLVTAYAKAQGLFRTAKSLDPVFMEKLMLDLGDVVPSMAGPKRPEGRVALPVRSPAVSPGAMTTEYKKAADISKRFAVDGRNFDLGHGDVVIAAITSCTNTSNPSVLPVGAGLLARNAAAKGLKAAPWVKHLALAPGSRWSRSISRSILALQLELDKVGFNLVGFGCTTCIGNSLARCRRRSRSRSTTTASSVPPCCRATATSRGRVSSRRAGQLLCLAAAGGRLRLGRNGDQGSLGRSSRSATATARTASRCT